MADPPHSIHTLARYLISLCVLLLVAGTRVRAYIPAVPTNDTALAEQGGLNITDASKLNLQWFQMGFNSENVSYQLVGAASTGVNKGALVHFSEEKLTNDTTITPWIALIACDANATDASMEDDIFTLAWDRGAVAALLFSQYSSACIINANYANPANFNQLMDIFSTQSLANANLIERSFALLNATTYSVYDPKLLNDSFAQINTTITNGTVRAPGYLFATLIAYNATDSITPDTGTVSSTAGTGGGSNGTGGPNTSLAMIILYAITGCVSALFCVVIVSGAIRAIRHPERYGPRSGDVVFGGPPGSGFGAAQSRARGLTRAILDTFPVVKFGRNEAAPADPARPKDLEHGITETRTNDSLATDRTGEANMELKSWEEVHYSSREAAPGLEAAAYSQLERESEEIEEVEAESPRASSSASVPPVVIPRSRRPVAGRLQVPSSGDRDIVPDAIGRETCPICIVDFEEGDDLRVLPCEGHHRFHQECVDQWLLELSSSCPLCRQDFQALQTMMAGDSSDHLEPPHMPEAAARPLSSAAARFSRYLRFARRRHGGREGPHGYDPTNPPMPVAAETTL